MFFNESPNLAKLVLNHDKLWMLCHVPLHAALLVKYYDAKEATFLLEVN